MNSDEIKKMLYELLNNLTAGFEQDELAYLSIQGKNELQIRDKIAWRMHCKIPKEEHIVVRREWKPNETDRHQVDLAILKLDNTNTNVEKCLALIEFKAQSIVRREKWYIDEFVKDVAKMKEICSSNENCANADMYFVFLHSAQNKYKHNEYSVAHASSNYYNNKTTICESKDDDNCEKAMEKEWKRFFEKADGRYKKEDHILEIKNNKLQTPKAKIQYLGEAYGIKCFTAAMIWGPVKKGDVEIDGE